MTRIDPNYGTEVSIDDYGVGAISASAPIESHSSAQAAPITVQAFTDLWANIKHCAVPAAWKPITAELARRLHERDPRAVDYAMTRGGLDVRPLAYIGPRSSGWILYTEPSEAARALDIELPTKAKPKSEPKSEKPAARGVGRAQGPQTHRAYGAAEAAPIVEAVHADHVWPTWALEWLGRLEYPPKRDYAHAWLRHVLDGIEAPDDPGTEWADKVRRRVEWLRG